MNRNYIEIANVLKSGESHKIAHPVHDLGVMAVELKKFFGLNKRAPERADPYIGHFLWQYSHGENEFYEIIRALPFFMSRGVAQDGAGGRVNFRSENYVLREAKACFYTVR